jgi:hypothetical protein
MLVCTLQAEKIFEDRKFEDRKNFFELARPTLFLGYREQLFFSYLHQNFVR